MNAANPVDHDADVLPRFQVALVEGIANLFIPQQQMRKIAHPVRQHIQLVAAFQHEDNASFTDFSRHAQQFAAKSRVAAQRQTHVGQGVGMMRVETGRNQNQLRLPAPGQRPD